MFFPNLSVPPRCCSDILYITCLQALAFQPYSTNIIFSAKVEVSKIYILSFIILVRLKANNLNLKKVLNPF